MAKRTATGADSRFVWLLVLLGVLILVADQTLKFWVKTHFTLGEEVALIGHWLRLHFTENNGIAFGMQPGSTVGKLLLSLFRIAAAGAMIYLLVRILRKGVAPRRMAIGLAIVIAGALGNIIDGTFYGVLFSSSEGLVMAGEELVQPVAQFLPAGGGYAPLFYGKVVDMIYAPIVDTVWPSWMPGIGGSPLVFFQPIFNLADAAITVGIAYMLIFNWKFLFGRKK